MTRLEQAMEQYNASHPRPMNAAELALKAGVHERTVKRHLAGMTKMDEDQIVAYAEALDMSPAELIGAAA